MDLEERPGALAAPVLDPRERLLDELAARGPAGIQIGAELRYSPHGGKDSMSDFLAKLLFGGSCFVCRGAARELLCEACREELPRLGDELCPRCALPSPRAAVCGRCLSEPPAYDATTAALAYDFPADTLVHALKFRGELALAPLLGSLLSASIPSWSVDRVIPVPLSTARLRSRGYNQAAEIARQLARGKLDVDVCVRRGDSVPQTEL